MKSSVFGRPSFLVLTSLAAAFALSGCGPSHRLPTYEPPIARTEYQTVRTTAYTHTESDHLAYGNRNALGGRLRAASMPRLAVYATSLSSASSRDRSFSDDDDSDSSSGYGFQRRRTPPPRAVAPTPAGAVTVRSPGSIVYTNPFGSAATVQPPAYQDGYRSAGPVVYGSAAADWSRWPVGTIFQITSTGQIYQVDDYGWALAGRNTIDLYQSTRSAMNAWGVRRVPIHVLHWGSREESLRRLRNHQKYRHIRRMVLELEGKNRAAARLE